MRAILERPETAGYRTAPWTCRRTVQFVRERFGVSYHPDHIGRLLRACGLSPQQPQRTAKDHRVRAWMQEEWPRVKELGRRRAWLICLDQTGVNRAPDFEQHKREGQCKSDPVSYVSLTLSPAGPPDRPEAASRIKVIDLKAWQA